MTPATDGSSESSQDVAALRTAWLLACVLPFIAAWPWCTFVSLARSPSAVQGCSGLVLCLFLAVSVVTDLKSRRIRNWACYPALADALLLNLGRSLAINYGDVRLIDAFGGIGIADSLSGAILCFSAMFTMFLLFGGGAGDVKLMVVLGALCGWRDAFQIWFCAMILGAVFSMAYVAIVVGPRRVAGFLGSKLGFWGQYLCLRLRCSDEDGRVVSALQFRIPLAPFFATATVIVLGFPYWVPGTTFFQALFG